MFIPMPIIVVLLVLLFIVGVATDKGGWGEWLKGMAALITGGLVVWGMVLSVLAFGAEAVFGAVLWVFFSVLGIAALFGFAVYLYEGAVWIKRKLH